ncbi:MAG TPA: Gfo/Idh/MocA family oxidoreductase [Planctomycetota bacterium]|nr:Gfo/Idh/MocA family oxidoreductase [Planctomycetota bacterium]
MLKAGILGFGGVGSGMARLMREHRVAEPVAACDVDPKALDRARAMGLEVTDDPNTLCAMDLDFVCVTSTNDVHCDHVLAAARAGKHILCEKPPALTLDELDRMIAATDEADVVTVVNYVRRFQPAYLRIKEEIDNGHVGEIMSIACFSDRGWGLATHGNPHPAVAHPERSGNWLVHHACHIVDYETWLCGPAKRAVCRGQSTVKGKDSPEVIWGMLEFAGGVIGVVGDAVSCVYQKWVNVIGTKGTMELIKTPTDNVLHVRWETGKEFPYFEDVLGYGTFWHHTSTLRHLVQCIERGERSPHDLRATRDSQVATLMLEKARQTGRIVSADEIDRG